MRVMSRMKFTPERIANARLPAPDETQMSISTLTPPDVHKLRTQASSASMLEAFPQTVDLDWLFSSVSPHDLPRLSQPLLVVGERDEILE